MGDAQQREDSKENGHRGKRLYTLETHDLGSGSQELLLRSGEPAVIANARHIFELLENRLANANFEGLARLVGDIPLELPEGYGAVELEMVRRNTEERQRFLDEHRVLNATEVHTQSGLRAKNEHATANRWRAQGRIFAVKLERRFYYPAFQFEYGEPKAVFRQLIAVGGPHYRGWPLALWLNAPNGWLEKGSRPIDMINHSPQAVVEALGNENSDIG